jgi:dipeptidyl aminopeptidase/acylaminoacyl peptidase
MERRVHFYSGPGLRICGILEIPRGVRRGEKRPGIVLSGGPGATKERLVPEVSRWLTAGGYVVLRLDPRGFGESEGPPRRLIPLEQVEDIQSAITFMEQQDEVDESRLGLWGTATGGAVATYTAGIDSRVRCLVSVNSAGDLGRWMRGARRYWEWFEFLRRLEEDRVRRVMTGASRFVNTYEIFNPDPTTISYMDTFRKLEGESGEHKRELSLEFAESMIAFRPETVAARIAPRAAMWLCASEDTNVPVDESRRLYDLAGEPKKLVIIEGLEHHALYIGEGFTAMMAQATGWFDSHLRDG